MRAIRVPLSLSLLLFVTPSTSLGQVPKSPVTFTPRDFMVPIHRSPHDMRGRWAAGPAYKACFDDGFTFYPHLGPEQPAHLPLRWRTSSITVGSRPLITELDAAEASHTDWRYEIHRPGVVEAYDVRADGVEQTFLLTERPPHLGELVISGRIATPLRAPAAAVLAAHAALTWVDAGGTPRIRYSEAWAFDARGRRAPVTTRVEGDELRLVLAADWLQEATFPVVVDPVTAPVTLETATAPINHLDVHRHVWTNDALFLVVSRGSTGNDQDVFGYACNTLLGNRVLVYADIGVTAITTHPSVASTRNPDRWIVAQQLQTTVVVQSFISVYFHDVGNTALNSGATRTTSAFGTVRRYPRVAGTPDSTAPAALVVFQADVTASNANTPTSTAEGFFVDPVAYTFGPVFRLDTAGGTRDREVPVVAVGGGSGAQQSWVVAWQELDRSVSNDDWDTVVNRVRLDRTRAQERIVGHDSDTRSKTRPAIAGRYGKYLVAYEMQGALNTSIGVQRLDWDYAAAAPTIKESRLPLTGPGLGATRIGNSIGFDPMTDSHWAIPYTVAATLRVMRVGYTGGVVEDALVDTAPPPTGSINAVAVTGYGGANSGFALTYGVGTSGQPLRGANLLYPTTAVNTLYGSGCGGSISARRPLAGTESFGVSLSGAPGLTPAVLFLAAGSAAIPISGMPGCSFNLDPASLLVVGTTTTVPVFGATLSLPLPDVPPLAFDLYFQWFYLDPPANPVGLLATQGLRAEVR